MSITMYSASVPIYDRMFSNMLTWLDKAEEYAEAKGFDSANYLGLRLGPDVLPFSRQIQIASDSCKGSLARLSGQEAPSWPDDEATFAELRGRIEKTLEFARSFGTEQLEGTDENEITFEVPGISLKFTGESFLKTFALPNFFFHCTMSYALLRQAGVPLGKMDYLGAP